MHCLLYSILRTYFKFKSGWSDTQISRQVCLETHFQHEFSILVRFGQSGLQREKKIQIAKSMLLLRLFFIHFGYENQPILKSSIFLGDLIFYLQPRMPKTAQDWKFMLEMCLKKYLSTNLWTASCHKLKARKKYSKII